MFRLVAVAGLTLGFALLALGRLGLTPRWWALLPVFSALAIVAVTDLATHRIPDVITLPGIAYGIALSAMWPDGRSVLEAALGITVGGGLALLLAIISRGGLGGGDIKLMAMLGAVLGWKGALLAFVLSQILGGVMALTLIAIRRRRGAHLPVGSLMAVLGALILIGLP